MPGVAVLLREGGKKGLTSAGNVKESKMAAGRNFLIDAFLKEYADLPIKQLCSSSGFELWLSCAYLVYSWCFSTVQSTVNQCLFYSLPNRMGGFCCSFHSSADLLEQLTNRKLRVWWYAWQEEASYNLCDGYIFFTLLQQKKQHWGKNKGAKR